MRLLILTGLWALVLQPDFGWASNQPLCMTPEMIENEGAGPETFEEVFAVHEFEEPVRCEETGLEMEIYRSSESSPVWGTFIRNLKSCAPGCAPANYHAYRNQRKSCHFSGRALDVGAIRCGSRLHSAISGGKFASMVQCMKSKMRVLYRNGPGRTTGHHDHGHFSLGCSVPGRPVYW